MDTTPSTKESVGSLVSLLLRLAVFSLFFAACVGKLKGGMTSVRGVVGFFQQTFAQTWLPMGLVTLHAYMTPFMEALISLWLLTGYRLRVGWTVTTLFMISLAFGMSVAGKIDTAAHNFNYVLICCAGLYFSRFDRYNAERLLSSKKPF